MKRIQRDTSHEELVKSLTTGEGAIFKEIWRVLLFASAIGIRSGKRRPLTNVDSGKAFPDTYFSIPGWRGFLYLIGVADSENSECLRGNEEAQDSLIKSFEEYANQGLYILSERLKSTSTPLDELISMLLEESQPEPPKPTVDVAI